MGRDKVYPVGGPCVGGRTRDQRMRGRDAIGRPDLGRVVGAGSVGAKLRPRPSRRPRSRGQIINVGGKDHIVVRWYVGLGSGTNPAQIALQQTVVNDFNKLQDERTDGKMPILLSLEIVQNSTATDILKTEIASGSAPDLIGPVGIKGRAGFAGQFLDMTPLIASAGYDMTQYPEKLVNTMKDGQTGALLGIPYAVYPSYIFYNKDLFDEAGLDYPPQKVGDKYRCPTARRSTGTGTPSGTSRCSCRSTPTARMRPRPGSTRPSRRSSVSSSSGPKAAASPPRSVPDRSSARTARPPSSRITGRPAGSGTTTAIWKDHFIADDTERNSDLLAKGNSLSSGHVAMGHMFQWYICCMSADATKPGAFKKWDIAVMPANSAGETTAPINIDTFTISKDSPVADRAFEAMTYLAGRLDLMALYGGTPAVGDQLEVLQGRRRPDVRRAVPRQHGQLAGRHRHGGLRGVPNHEAEMPNYIKAQNDYTKVFTTLCDRRGPRHGQDHHRTGHDAPGRLRRKLRSRAPQRSELKRLGRPTTCRPPEPLDAIPERIDGDRRRQDIGVRAAAPAKQPRSSRDVVGHRVPVAVARSGWWCSRRLPILASLALSLTNFNILQPDVDPVHRPGQLRADVERARSATGRSVSHWA